VEESGQLEKERGLDDLAHRREMMTTTRLLTVSEVACWLAVSPSWVRDHAAGRRRPALPCIKLGKSLRFEEKRVAEWLDALRRAGRAA
jgi:predicted DNA-binding transcriptional regulator AlpA